MNKAHIKNPDNIHILVVDDEVSVGNLLQRAIRSAGYKCSIARNALDALKIIGKNSVDVVLTDIEMPGLNGIELTGIVKEKHESDVIVMTGYADELTYEDIVAKGARDFMQKPVSPGELLIRLKRVLEERAIIAE